MSTKPNDKLDPLTFLAFALCLFLAVEPASADLITNGGFETGDLTGWKASNNVNVQTKDALDNIKPFEGKYMAVLATGVGALDATLGQRFNADGYSAFTLSFAYNMQALDLSMFRDRTNGDTLSAKITALRGEKSLITETINDPFW